MKRAANVIIAIVIYTCCAIVLAGLVHRIVERDRRIADLEERNAALSRLCGPDPTREPYEPLHIEHPVPEVQP